MSRTRTLAPLALVATAAATALAAGIPSVSARAARSTTCPELPQGAESVALDPAAFTTTIDNAYLPLRPGTRRVYRETEPDGARRRVVVTVTRQTRTLANGVVARVVRDTVSEGGATIEDTFDYYAQDRAGNVWYLGEDTHEYEHGRVVSTEGSFEAGVDGAQGGIAMPARPRVGCAYRQEQYTGHAEDRAAILSLEEQAEVPAGHYANAVLIREWTPLEPRVLEYKLYARGVGEVLALSVSGGSERGELLRTTRVR
jgi:hypothetical protein